MAMVTGYIRGVAIVPSDTTVFTKPCNAIYVGVTGDVTVLTAADDVVQFKAAPAGTVLPICAKRVNASGTTATNLVALGTV